MIGGRPRKQPLHESDPWTDVGIYGPDHAQFTIRRHNDGRRELVNVARLNVFTNFVSFSQFKPPSLAEAFRGCQLHRKSKSFGRDAK